MVDWSAMEDTYVFWNVARTGSFTRAAAELHIPKSQVSRRVADLERKMKKVLLTRTTRRVHLTEMGANYYTQIDSIMRDWNAALEKLRRQSETTLPLRITLTSDLAAFWMPTVLAKYWKKFPDQKIELRENRSVVSLAEEKIELAIRFAGHKTPGTVRTPLGKLKIGLYASTRLQHEICRADIEDQKIQRVAFELPESVRKNVPPQHLFAKVLRLPYRIQVSEFATALKFCLSGEGLLAMPDFLAEQGLAAKLLYTPFPKDFLLLGPLEMVSLENRFLSSPLRHLMHEVEDFAKAHLHEREMA